MKAHILAVLALGLLLGCDAPKKDPPKADLAKFEGSWKSVSCVIDGGPATKDHSKTFTFKGDIVETSTVYESHKNEWKGTFKLNPNKTPKEIDLIRSVDGKDVTLVGIYEMDGDNLKLYYRNAEDGNRPANFATERSDMAILVNLKRE